MSPLKLFGIAGGVIITLIVAYNALYYLIGADLAWTF